MQHRKNSCNVQQLWYSKSHGEKVEERMQLWLRWVFAAKSWDEARINWRKLGVKLSSTVDGTKLRAAGVFQDENEAWAALVGDWNSGWRCFSKFLQNCLIVLICQVQISKIRERVPYKSLETTRRKRKSRKFVAIQNCRKNESEKLFECNWRVASLVSFPLDTLITSIITYKLNQFMTQIVHTRNDPNYILQFQTSGPTQLY